MSELQFRTLFVRTGFVLKQLFETIYVFEKEKIRPDVQTYVQMEVVILTNYSGSLQFAITQEALDRMNGQKFLSKELERLGIAFLWQ